MFEEETVFAGVTEAGEAADGVGGGAPDLEASEVELSIGGVDGAVEWGEVEVA